MAPPGADASAAAPSGSSLPLDPPPDIKNLPPPPSPSWPPLRDELRLSQGPSSEHGAPTWTLHDPAAHRFYRIGWLEFEVLSRWFLGSPEAVRQAICRETTLFPTQETVRAVYDFALRNNLIRASTPADTRRLLEQKEAGSTSLWHKIMHGYLFLRIPLVSPDSWLSAAVHRVGWMFSRRFFALLACLALIGVYLISREWVSFLVHVQSLWSWQQSLMVLFALALAKTVHELGHAFAAKHLGLRVPRMGVALMCFMPVLWTDVSESWKLPGRSERLLIDLSGVGAEILLATAASLLWPLLPPGDAKSAMLTLAGVTWIATLTVNANPFMRYDGYFILSDYWEIPGLQQRAFALARWRLRETLFGFGDPPPEAMRSGTRRKLFLYAYGTWIYRFFLFLGIALLVYHLFFKALGLALMLVELVWFIGLPIYKEIAHWWSRRDAIRYTPQSLRSGLIALGLILFFVTPWHGAVRGTGLLTARHAAVLYAPQPAVVAGVLAAPGQAVDGGQTLLLLASPELEANIEILRRKLETLAKMLAAASLDPELRLSYSRDIQEMQSIASELKGLQQEKERLTILAPFSGVFRDLPAWLVPGVWLPEKTKLGAVTDTEAMVTAYVAEEDIDRLHAGAKGVFYPLSGLFPAVPVAIVSLEQYAVRDIPQIELPATSPGGLLPAKRTPEGYVVPEQALYKVVCKADLPDAPAQALSGVLSFQGERRSFAARLWQAALGVLIRESGLE